MHTLLSEDFLRNFFDYKKSIIILSLLYFMKKIKEKEREERVYHVIMKPLIK